jgi:hypothetical protein
MTPTQPRSPRGRGVGGERGKRLGRIPFSRRRECRAECFISGRDLTRVRLHLFDQSADGVQRPHQQRTEFGVRAYPTLAQCAQHLFELVRGVGDARQLEHPRRALDGMGGTEEFVDRIAVQTGARSQRRQSGFEPPQMVAGLASETG